MVLICFFLASIEASMNQEETKCKKQQPTKQELKTLSFLSVEEAVYLLNQQKITSQQLVSLMIQNAKADNRRLNFLSEQNFEEAILIAIKCDQTRQRRQLKNWVMTDPIPYSEQKFLPPLFGIPISIKDVFNMKGYQTTLGCQNKRDCKAGDSPLITCLKKSGMIPFCRTNVPPLISSYQTVNNIWGRTLNPWNTERTPGGSSGGQGSMIASGSSMLGVGSDSGGSIRCPSEFCGIFGLKPNSHRISSSYHEILGDYLRFSTIPICIGPMARSAADLALFMTVASCQQFYDGSQDFYNPPIPFNRESYIQMSRGSKKLRIGYYNRLSCSQIFPASARALKQVLQILSNCGHELIQIEIPNEKDIIIEFNKQFCATGGKGYEQALKGEKLIKQQEGMFDVSQMSSLRHTLLSYTMKKTMPRIYSYLFQQIRPMKVLEYQKQVGKFQQFKKDWIRYWKQKDLDLIVAPGVGFPAPRHGTTPNIAVIMAYLFIWNALDMAAGSLPVTTVRKEQEYYRSEDKDWQTDELIKNAVGSEGLAVGVQVVGLPFEEEKVLGMMSFLQKRILFYEKYPLPDSRTGDQKLKID